MGEVGAGRRQALVLARRELRGHRALALLVVLLVAAPVAAGTMLAVMERTAASTARQIYLDFGPADAGVDVSGYRKPAYEPPPFDPALLPAGSRVVPTPKHHRAGFLGPAGEHVPGDLLEADATEPLTRNRARLVTGRPPGPDEALVNHALARRLGLLQGGRLRPEAELGILGGGRARITGLSRNPGCLSCPQAIVAFGSPLALFERPPDSDWLCCGELPPQARFDHLIDLPDGTDAEALSVALEVEGIHLTPRAMFDLDLLHFEIVDPWHVRAAAAARTPVLGGLVLLLAGLLTTTAFGRSARRLTGSQDLAPRTVRRAVLALGAALGAVGAVAGTGLGLLVTRLTQRWWERRADSAFDAWYGRPYEVAAVALAGAAACLVAAAAAAGRTGRPTSTRTRAACLRGGFGLAALGGGAVLAFAGRRSLTDAQFRYPSRFDGVQIAGNLYDSGRADGGVVLVLLGATAAAVGLVLLGPALAALARSGGDAVPATAAVALAVAGAVAVTVFVATDRHASYLRAVPATPPETVYVSRGDNGASDPAGDFRDAAAAVAVRLPALRRLSVRAPVLPTIDDRREAVLAALEAGARPPAGLLDPAPVKPDSCPEGAASCSLPAAELAIAEPALIRLAGGERADEAAVAAALAAGKVVVLDSSLVDAAGHVHVTVSLTGGRPAYVRLPAAVFPRQVRYDQVPAAFVSAATARGRGWAVREEGALLVHRPATLDHLRYATSAAAPHPGASAMWGYGGEPGPGGASRWWAGGMALLACLVAAVAAGLAGSRAAAGLGIAVGAGLGFGVAWAVQPVTGALETVLPWTGLGLVVAAPLLGAAASVGFSRARAFVRQGGGAGT